MFRELWQKRESVSAHMAWGLAVFLSGVVRGLECETALVLVILVGAAWELGGEIVTRRLEDRDWIKIRHARGIGGPEFDRQIWKARLLDVPPWIVGGVLGWIVYP